MLYKAYMQVKLIAIDLDDTLLNPDLSISPENTSAIKAALNAGIHVILASGRTIKSMKPYAKAIGIAEKDYPIICANGAEIRHSGNGKIIRQFTIEPGSGKKIVEELIERGLPVQTYDDDWIIYSAPNSLTVLDSQLTGIDARQAEPVSELYSKARSKFLCSGEPDYLAELAPVLSKHFESIAEVVITKPFFLEVLPQGVDKGEALAWLAKEMGIQKEEVMAIGDAANDLGMISWAGYGCAPADAIPSVLAVAKHISHLPHDKGAVADLINRLALLQN